MQPRRQMNLYRMLASGLLESHPDDAARVLESLPEESARAVLSGVPSAVAAETLRHMAPHKAASTLQGLSRADAGPIVESLGPDLAANILRRMDAEARETLVAALSEGRARSLRTLLSYPAGTAGAVMDPDVLALPGDITAEEAVAQIRAAPERVRYNLYVLDRDHVLVGVLNLRELFLARRRDLLSAIAHPEVLSIRAEADHVAVVKHAAWDEVRSIPVVDGRGVYLGAVRYQAMRRLEEQLRLGEPEDATSTVAALSDLFSTGIAGVFGTLAASVAQPLPRGETREP